MNVHVEVQASELKDKSKGSSSDEESCHYNEGKDKF